MRRLRTAVNVKHSRCPVIDNIIRVTSAAIGQAIWRRKITATRECRCRLAASISSYLRVLADDDTGTLAADVAHGPRKIR